MGKLEPESLMILMGKTHGFPVNFPVKTNPSNYEIDADWLKIPAFLKRTPMKSS